MIVILLLFFLLSCSGTLPSVLTEKIVFVMGLLVSYYLAIHFNANDFTKEDRNSF